MDGRKDDMNAMHAKPIELFGGPLDGERLCVAPDTRELHVPAATSLVGVLDDAVPSLERVAIHRHVYRERGRGRFHIVHWNT